jgi:hypothetical protein
VAHITHKQAGIIIKPGGYAIDFSNLIGVLAHRSYDGQNLACIKAIIV